MTRCPTAACLASLDPAGPWLWAWLAGAVVALTLAYVFRYWLLVAWPLWLVSRTLYRIKVYGREHVPRTGPALLVCNHVSHLDAGLVLAAAPRPVRFLIWAPFVRNPLLRPFLRAARVIPINSQGGPRAIIQSLRAASDALVRGEVVCIFAEGGITRTGFLLPFHRGLEHIAQRSPAPVIPVYLDHVWGSVFSFQGGKFFWKLPRQFPYSLGVNFGKPLPPTAPAVDVRQAIQELSAESALHRFEERLTVPRQFVRNAAWHPFRPCLIDPLNDKKPVLRYGEALAGARILAKRLRPVLAGDDMVGVWLPPSAGGALANVALAFLGKTSVNLNYTSSEEAVRSAARQCKLRRVLTSRLFTHRLPLDPGPGVELVYLEDFRKEITRWERLRAFLGVLLLPWFVQERWPFPLHRQRHHDLLTVIFSSGSTGEPKGVMLAHGNVAGNSESVTQAIDIAGTDRLLGILPFFHSFGYTVTLWAPLYAGASIVFYPNPLAAKEVGEVCRRWRPTIMLATPTFLRHFLKRCQPDDFKSLWLLICGAEKLPQPLAEEFRQKFGILPLEGYGCTELSPVAAANVPDWEEGGLRQIGTKPGTIGQPLPGVAARVVDRETFRPLSVGQEGLLLMKGANVMKGYLGRPDLTARKVIDGWYVTGDLARLDEDGFVTITGREERFAKVGGEMVPLERVEEEIHQVLETNDRACVVTAIPDERKGERIVVLHLSLNGTSVEQVRQSLGGRGLPNIAIPGPRDFYQVDELPLLGSGKVDLKKCKDTAAQLASGA